MAVKHKISFHHQAGLLDASLTLVRKPKASSLITFHSLPMSRDLQYSDDNLASGANYGKHKAAIQTSSRRGEHPSRKNRSRFQKHRHEQKLTAEEPKRDVSPMGLRQGPRIVLGIDYGTTFTGQSGSWRNPALVN